jgi:hypothetical protein
MARPSVVGEGGTSLAVGGAHGIGRVGRANTRRGTIMRATSGLWVVGISSALAIAACANVDEPVAVVHGALTVNQANVFGFEDSTQWSSSVTLSSSSTHSQGTKSLGVAAKGYVEVKSAALPALTGVTGMMSFDLLLPTAQPNPYWYGNAQLLISVPSKGVNNLFIGQQELTGKPLNQFVSLDFNLPQSLVSTLQAGGYTDFTAKVALNVPSNATGTYLLDNLHFVAGAVGATDLVETNILTNWTSGSEDNAATTLSVLSGSQAYFGQSALRAVTASGFDFWLRYNAPSPIDIGTNDYLRVAARALNTSPNGWQVNAPILVVEDTTGARMTLTPASILLPTDGTTWIDVRAPLAGGGVWTRSGATVDLHHVRAVEVHTDTWDSGFTLDIDAVQFTRRFDTCSGTPATVTLTATARATTASVTPSAVSGAIGYDIYRSTSGGTPAFVNRTRTTLLQDFGLTTGTTYTYEVRPVMASGCESGSAVATVTTASSATGLSRVPTIHVLVAIYSSPSAPYTATQISQMQAGMDFARQYYFRNTRGRLNLAFDYFQVNADGPSTDGPTMANVETDLRARGILDNQVDAVYVWANNLGGCWGGFTLLGQTAGAFGTVCGVPFPSNDSSIDPTMPWNFTHEFQHALDLVLVQGSGQDMIYGHPDAVYGDTTYTGPIIDAGEHFDWERATLRMFSAYDTLAAPFNDYIEVDDPDGDRLASNDARVPMDEARFGSSPTLRDTDNDGLDDMSEYAAGTFGGSNPTVADTDGDGQLDGVDPTPRAALAASMTAKTPTIDGVRDSGYTLLRNGVEFTNVTGFSAATYIAYDANNFYILAEENQSASIFLIVDGSGANGFWAGDDSYSFTMTPGDAAPVNHTTRHTTDDPGAPVGAMATRTSGGITTIEARIPRTGLGQGFGYTGSTTNGFSTSVGSVLGLRVTFTRFGGAGDLFNPPWATVDEYYHFSDVTLR